ncbi:MAG: sigma-70 family RNA polymerase sigma factor [Alphaproteobacteria bacterium]|nr:sigma-70 family RNA polymerase sigma factor [Alphaproteobacteria bacterium]
MSQPTSRTIAFSCPSHVAAALDGDTVRRQAMFALLAPVIARRVRRTLRTWRPDAGQEQVDDLVQDVHAALLERDGRRLRAWDPARGASLTTFVDRISARIVISWLRSPRRSASPEQAAAPEDMGVHACQRPSPERDVAGQELFDTIVAGVTASLSPRDAALFHALLVEEREIDELIAEHGLSQGALYVRRCRLRKVARAVAEAAVA